MREVDGNQMRRLEALARDIGHTIGNAIEGGGKKYGFTLLLFSFDGPELTYISNSNRADMVKALEEFIARQKNGEANQLWHERN